jgi:hypothetical protein
MSMGDVDYTFRKRTTLIQRFIFSKNAQNKILPLEQNLGPEEEPISIITGIGPRLM